jgi:2-polyprenyl-6-methoxyphenol hydroxylase-like FAD-dependent oxidoreductase
MHMATTECCIVGGGPGGMMLALLLARQGVQVVLLEAHQTFEREFRGDNVHPSTMALIEELGLMDRLRALPHVVGSDFPIHTPDGKVSPPPPEVPSQSKTSIAVPQAAFLGMLADAAREYPSFQLETGARVEQLIQEAGQVVGVRYRALDGWHEVRAQLVVGADGRFSKVRQLAQIPFVSLAQGFDLLWLRLPKAPMDPLRAYGLYPGERAFLVISDRVDAWHVGLGFPKGAYQRLREVGIQAVRDTIVQLAPWLVDRVQVLDDWNQTSLLAVQAGRVKRWHRPGLLLIGDAAHVMSPVFGVGINYAIQDAVVAANVLGPRLREGNIRSRDLAAVQRRRERPTRIMQWMQTFGEHQSVSGPLTLQSRIVRRLVEMPPMNQLRRRLIEVGGLRTEHVRPLTEPDEVWQLMPPMAALGFPWPLPVRLSQLANEHQASRARAERDSSLSSP